MPALPASLTQSINRRIARGSFWTLVGTGSGRLMHLVAMVLAARILGAEGFGGFALVQSTLGLFGMFAGAALGATATRFIAATYQNDPVRTGRIAALVFGAALVAALVSSLAILAAAPWFARSVLGASALATATAIGGALVGLGVLRGVQDAALAGFEAFRDIAFLRCAEGVTALALVPVLADRFGPAGVVAAIAIGLLMAFCPGIVLVMRAFRNNHIRLTWRGAAREWKILRDFSAPTLLASSLATPLLWFCAVLLGRTQNGFTELGVYQAAYQWHGPLVFVPMAIASVSLPVLTQTWEKGDLKDFQRLFLQVVAIGTVLALLPALVLAVSNAQVMRLYGSGFASLDAVLILLVLAAPLHVASNIATAAILSMNGSWYLPGFHAVWGGSLLGIAMLTIWEHGAVGLASAFLASYFLLATTKVLFVMWFVKGKSLAMRETAEQ